MSDPAQVQRRYDAAMAMVKALCRPRGTPGKREWLMSIPAQPKDDPDIVIADSLFDVPKLLAENERLRETLRQVGGVWLAINRSEPNPDAIAVSLKTVAAAMCVEIEKALGAP
jgi:hypothetical protein